MAIRSSFRSGQLIVHNQIISNIPPFAQYLHRQLQMTTMILCRYSRASAEEQKSRHPSPAMSWKACGRTPCLNKAQSLKPLKLHAYIMYASTRSEIRMSSEELGLPWSSRRWRRYVTCSIFEQRRCATWSSLDRMQGQGTVLVYSSRRMASSTGNAAPPSRTST